MALASGIAVALLGLVVPPLRVLYDYAWFVGFAVAGAVYIGLMQKADAPAELPDFEVEG
jgi:NCS1 family nucleobase:cation symporter-1